MKLAQNNKDQERMDWDPMRSQARGHRLIGFLGFFVLLTYIIYTLKLISTPTRSCVGNTVRKYSLGVLPIPNITQHKDLNITQHKDLNITQHKDLNITQHKDLNITQQEEDPVIEMNTNFNITLEDLAFGIAGSANFWENRKEYIKLWWKKKYMRGVVWMDRPVTTQPGENLPLVKVSSNVKKFNQQHILAIRITRIVSEMYRLRLKNVKWFVMGDDDTFFVPNNVVQVLSKYDHNEFYYIGSSSESHTQNIFFSYNMAFGGGGFAISYPLAQALEKMQDECIKRYPTLFVSDDKMQACMAELGVPLTREPGFHQFDVVGNIFGLLAAHPVAPLVSMHHLDVVEPIFPNMTRLDALRLLTIPMKYDSDALVQQSICYDRKKEWTVSVSWGFAVQVFRGILSPREIELPSRTFLNWQLKDEYMSHAFNSRPISRNACQKPFLFYFKKAKRISWTNQTVSEYTRHRVPHPACQWDMANPRHLEKVQVYKKPDPHLWNRSPRRNCCRVMKAKRRSVMVVDVGLCREGEFSAV